MAIQFEFISDQMDGVKEFAVPNANIAWERCENVSGRCRIFH